MQLKRAPEFAFIHHYLKKLSGPGSLNLTDDAALLEPERGMEFVLTADSMVEGVHFLPNDPVDTIGRKLMRCNLSDLAGMGAIPVGYLMTLSLPRDKFDENWFSLFCQGISEDQKKFNVFLLGGDTTRSNHDLVLSMTMIGKVKQGQALRRNKAKSGDGIWVTGTIGDGALGLLTLQGKVTDHKGYLAERYRLPKPRVNLLMGGIASTGMDISDGLVQDLGHIVRESQIGAVVEISKIPRSEAALKLGDAYLLNCLTGGDDYELLLTIPPDQEGLAIKKAEAAGVPLTKIGYCTNQIGETCFLDDQGQEINFQKSGWSHI